MVFHSRYLDNTNLKQIGDHLEQTDFNFLHDLTVDNAHETFINLLTEITDLHAPIKTIVVHPNKIIINPWMTPAIIKYTKQTLQKKDWTNQPHAHHIKNM